MILPAILFLFMQAPVQSIGHTNQVISPESGQIGNTGNAGLIGKVTSSSGDNSPCDMPTWEYGQKTDSCHFTFLMGGGRDKGITCKPSSDINGTQFDCSYSLKRKHVILGYDGGVGVGGYYTFTPMPEVQSYPTPDMHHYTYDGAGFNDATIEVLNPSASVTVHAKDSTMVKLSDDEYAHLQALRLAVSDEEKRLAVKYGAYVPPTRPVEAYGGMYMTMCDRLDGCRPDTYTFHGQFLLIEKVKR